MKNKKKNGLIIVLLILLIACIIYLLVGREQPNTVDDLQSEPGTASSFYIEEDEDYEADYMKHPSNDFIGSWTATSEHVKYLFGNIDLDIAQDGTWSGNIASTDEYGSWQVNEEGIRLQCENIDYIFYKLAYTDSNILLLTRRDGSTAVLIRK